MVSDNPPSTEPTHGEKHLTAPTAAAFNSLPVQQVVLLSAGPVSPQQRVHTPCPPHPRYPTAQPEHRRARSPRDNEKVTSYGALDVLIFYRLTTKYSPRVPPTTAAIAVGLAPWYRWCLHNTSGRMRVPSRALEDVRGHTHCRCRQNDRRWPLTVSMVLLCHGRGRL